VYERPTNQFVADFLGQSNFFEGEISEIRDEEAVVTTVSGAVVHALPRPGLSVGRRVTVAVRPEKITLTADEVPADNLLTGTVTHVTYLGNSTSYVIDSRGEGSLIVSEQNVLAGSAFSAGSEIVMTWDKDSCFVVST
jgi:ABC-type Fe3+/spermidine/putrescine transport system ATPase subunit